MTSQCPRCLSSSFKLLSNGRCTFCIGHFVRKEGVHMYQHVHMRFEKDLDEPTVLNGRDRTTSGVIGQP